MALFETGIVSSLSGLITALDTFLGTAGGGNPAWDGGDDVDGVGNTLDTTAGEWALSKIAQGTNTPDIQVAFQWDTASPNALGIYQYLHASGAGNFNNLRAGPWDQDNDSGNGAASTTDATLLTARSVPLSNTPQRYWAFTGTTPAEYVHIVVRVNATDYVHFGWGELEKFNDWNGGCYAYGFRQQLVVNQNQTIQTGTSILLDGVANDGSSPNPTNGMELFMATIQADGLPQQAAAGLWSVVGGNQADTGLDRQSNGGGTDTARVFMVGGYRGNELARSIGGLGVTPDQGFLPAYPIMIWYWNRVPSTVYGPIGVMPDVQGANIAEFSAGDEVVIGSDTWVLFPAFNKGLGNEIGSTKHQGMMYKRN